MQSFHFLTLQMNRRIMQLPHLIFSEQHMSNPQEQKVLSAVPPAPAAGAPAATAAAPAGPAKSNRKVLVIAGLVAIAALAAGGRMWYRLRGRPRDTGIVAHLRRGDQGADRR
jgi:hypothetical protein